MLDIKEIQKTYYIYSGNELKNEFSQFILKEYFQYKVLNIIYNSKWTNNLIFLGGTNLRIIHDIKRFSEDLDFDVFGNYSKQDHENLCIYICNELSKEGFEVNVDSDQIKNSEKHTAFTRYINFPGILKQQGLHNDPTKKFLLKLDAQPHKYGDFSYTPEDQIINKFDVFTSVKTTPVDIILAMKYCSILERQKGRDFYDIIFLSSRTKPNISYLENRFKYGKLKEDYKGASHLKKKILESTKDVNWKNKIAEIERFIFNPEDSKKVEMFIQWLNSSLYLKSFP